MPVHRREFGFDNRSFYFDWRGRFFDGKCLTQEPLPDYPITRITTGQWLEEEGRALWQAGINLDALARLQGMAAVYDGFFQLYRHGEQAGLLPGIVRRGGYAGAVLFALIPGRPATTCRRVAVSMGSTILVSTLANTERTGAGIAWPKSPCPTTKSPASAPASTSPAKGNYGKRNFRPGSSIIIPL